MKTTRLVFIASFTLFLVYLNKPVIFQHPITRWMAKNITKSYQQEYEMHLHNIYEQEYRMKLR